MFTFLKIATVLFDILAIVKIYKDERYLFDNEKIKYYAIVIFVPIFGAIYTLNRLSFNWFSIFTPHKNIKLPTKKTIQ